MFRAVLSNTDLLRNTIPIIADIIDEGVFKVDKNGISLLAPDRTMVSVVDFRLLAPAFDEFKVDQPVELGLNMANLLAVMKRLKSSDRLLIEHEAKGRLRLTVEGSSKRTFEIPLLDITQEKPPIDQLTFTGRVELDGAVVEEGISDADVIGDAVHIEANPEVFRMFAKGDVSTTELELKKKDKGLLKLSVGSAIKSQYPLEYLKKMIKANKLVNQLVLEFGADYPLRLTFQEIDKMHLSFVLAPRVSDE